MLSVFSSDRGTTGLLVPGLLAAMLGSSAVACLQVFYGGTMQAARDLDLPTPMLMVLTGVSGAFGAFLTVMLCTVLVWVYGRALQGVDAGFVRTLALVAFVLGVAAVLQLVVSGTEVAVTGAVPDAPFTNFSRYLGPAFDGLDLVNLISAALLFVGSRRYLGFGTASAGVLASLLVLVNFTVGVLV